MRGIEDFVKEALGAQGFMILQLQAINTQQAARIAELEKKTEDTTKLS